jgi:hypothetical protein
MRTRGTLPRSGVLRVSPPHPDRGDGEDRAQHRLEGRGVHRPTSCAPTKAPTKWTRGRQLELQPPPPGRSRCGQRRLDPQQCSDSEHETGNGVDDANAPRRRERILHGTAAERRRHGDEADEQIQQDGAARAARAKTPMSTGRRPGSSVTSMSPPGRIGSGLRRRTLTPSPRGCPPYIPGVFARRARPRGGMPRRPNAAVIVKWATWSPVPSIQYPAWWLTLLLGSRLSSERRLSSSRFAPSAISLHLSVCRRTWNM